MPVRSQNELALGANLASVRVHHDASAAELATTVDARAFTQGEDVFVGADVTNYASALSHELTHVAQGGAEKGAVLRLPKDEDELMDPNAPDTEDVAANDTDLIDPRDEGQVQAAKADADALIDPRTEGSDQDALMKPGEDGVSDRKDPDAVIKPGEDSAPDTSDPDALMDPNHMDDTASAAPSWQGSVVVPVDEAIALSKAAMPDFAAISNKLGGVGEALLSFSNTAIDAQEVGDVPSLLNAKERTDTLLMVCLQYMGQKADRAAFLQVLADLQDSISEAGEGEADVGTAPAWPTLVTIPFNRAAALCRGETPDFKQAEEKLVDVQDTMATLIEAHRDNDDPGLWLSRIGQRDRVQTVRMVLYQYMNRKVSLEGFRDVLGQLKEALPGAKPRGA